MSVILSKSFVKGLQALELFVKYDPKTNEVTEVKSIFLKSHGITLPAGNLLMAFLEDGINKLIDDTDWRDIYQQSKHNFFDDNEHVHPTVLNSIAHFIRP